MGKLFLRPPGRFIPKNTTTVILINLTMVPRPKFTKSDCLVSMLGYGLDWDYTPTQAGLHSFPSRRNRPWGILVEEMMKIHLHPVQKLKCFTINHN
jgi:hypothetical protein